MMIRLKRAYEAPGEEDGTSVLVERLWPRGPTKEKAAIDVWLREWYSHDESRWERFRRRYWAELEANGEGIQRLLGTVSKDDVTFVFAAKDPEHCSAAVMRDFILSVQAHAG